MMMELRFRLSKGEESCAGHFKFHLGTKRHVCIYIYIYTYYIHIIYYILYYCIFCDVVGLPHQVEEHPVAPLPPLPLPRHLPAPADPVAVTLKPAQMCQLP